MVSSIKIGLWRFLKSRTDILNTHIKTLSEPPKIHDKFKNIFRCFLGINVNLRMIS